MFRTSHSIIGAVGEGPMLTAAGRTVAVPALDEVVFMLTPVPGSGMVCPAATLTGSLTPVADVKPSIPVRAAYPYSSTPLVSPAAGARSSLPSTYLPRQPMDICCPAVALSGTVSSTLILTSCFSVTPPVAVLSYSTTSAGVVIR
ncbi:hypothetical protein [Microbispora sp. CA-102843]|uniref:hypothetical protein n=1 Tax=Microbispora sp. CA-102843 TaxID=3239952 RepID=UPI003D8B8A4B